MAAQHYVGQRLEGMSDLRVIDPVGYLDFLKLMDCARLVLTDSGGIQEETTILGVLDEVHVTTRVRERDHHQFFRRANPGSFRVESRDPAVNCALVVVGGVDHRRPEFLDITTEGLLGSATGNTDSKVK